MSKDKPKPEKKKVPPEKESVYLLTFTLVVYVCMLVLLAVAIPRVVQMFESGGSGSSHLLGQAGTMIGTLVQTEYDADTQRYRYAAGRLWYLWLVPMVLLIAIQAFVNDKAVACKLYYGLAVVLGVALILGSVALLIEVFQATAGQGGI